MRVREINRFDDLLAVRADWDRLFALTPGATFFHTFEWLAAYWRHYGQQLRLRAMLVEDGPQLAGIVPLVVKAEPTKIGPVRVLTYPLHDWGSFYSPLGADRGAILRAALEHVRETARDWDLLDLRWIDPALDAGATADAMQRAGLPFDEQAWAESALVELSGHWEGYWSGRQSHWRTNVRRSERKLAEAGAVRYVRHRSPRPGSEAVDPRWDLYDACVQLAGRSWQSSATDGTTLSHDGVRAFLKDAHAAAAARGAVDINLLYVGERPVAFAYNYAHAGWVYGLRTGFDAAVSRDGSGSVLIGRMIRDSFERGDRVLDLGAGYLEAKRFWHTTLRASHRATHFPRGAPRAQALRLKRWFQQWLTRATK